MTGYLAYSIAGHDKGKLYFIMREEQDFVYVSDGLIRPVEKLKRKNKKHIQIIKNFGQRTNIESMTNEEVKRLIKVYCNGMKEVK